MAIVLPLVSTWNDKGVKQADADVKSAMTGWQKVGKGLQKAFVPAVAAVASVSTFAIKAGKSASELLIEERR